MNYKEAMTEAIQGKKVCLSTWRDGQYLEFDGTGFVRYYSDTFEVSGIEVFSTPEGLENDWEVYQSKEVLDLKQAYEAMFEGKVVKDQNEIYWRYDVNLNIFQTKSLKEHEGSWFYRSYHAPSSGYFVIMG